MTDLIATQDNTRWGSSNAPCPRTRLPHSSGPPPPSGRVTCRVATHRSTAQAGALRSGVRARRLRRRLRRRHEGPQVAPDPRSRRSQVLVNLDHRGACGAEANTGDGAGVLMQMPHGFCEEVCQQGAHHAAGARASTAAASSSCRATRRVRRRIEERFEQIVQSEGQPVLGWRTVPTDNAMLGETARSCEPFMRQVFIGRNPAITRRARVRAQALRHPQARLQRDPHVDAGGRGVLVRRQPVAAARSSTKAC